MDSFQPPLLVGIHISCLVTGIFGNLFILIINFQDWLKTHDYNPSILIINSIAFTNIFLQGAIVFNEVIMNLFMEFYLHVWVVNPLAVILSSLVFSSLWCSTVLCFYYCIKIVNFSSSFFYKLKAKISILVPWLLIISVAASRSVGLSAYWDLYIDIKLVTDPMNVTFIIPSPMRSRCNCLFLIYMLFAAFAFSLIFVNVTAIVTSLCKQMIRMRKNSEGSGNSKLNTHLSAAKTVISLLLLYLIFYGSLSSIFSGVENIGNSIFLLSVIVVSGFPTFSSITLIMGNRKLSNSLKKLLGIENRASNTEVTVTTY